MNANLSRRPDASKCMSGRHDWVPENLAPRWGGGSTCRLCRNEWQRARYRPHPRPRAGAPTGPQRRTRDMLEDVAFLFETGLSLTAIAAKFNIQQDSLTKALRRHGASIQYDRSRKEWRIE